MKLSHLLFCALCSISLNLFSQVEYKIVTSVESIVPLGVGRSRLITTDSQKSFADYTSSRSGEIEFDKRK